MSLAKSCLLFALVALVPLPVAALSEWADFEGLPQAEGTPVVSVPTAPEMTISGAILVKPGNPRFAFNGASQGGSGGIDDARSGNTIAPPDHSGSTIVITFSVPVSGLAFDLVDVEVASVTEVITCRVYDGGNTLLHTIVVTGGDPLTGDGALTPVLFWDGFPGSSSVERLEIEASFNNPGSTLAGWAVDSIIYCPSVLPVEASTWGQIKALYE